jgi:hypothetical protein
VLTEEGFYSPYPRKIFIEDMIILIKALTNSSNDYTILMMDANDNINDSEGSLSNLLRETKLSDIF